MRHPNHPRRSRRLTPLLLAVLLSAFIGSPPTEAAQSPADHDTDVYADTVGAFHGWRMMQRFAWDRDYEAALIHARTLLRPEFEASSFRPIAEALARQLPNRSEDFVTLTLPTPTEWARLKRSLPRRAQVDYLVSRLRLINAFESGHPGGVALFETQHAGAWHLEYHFDERDNPSPVVIHPLIELDSLGLRLSELPWLFGHVLDDDYLPVYGQSHGHLPTYTVGDVVEMVIVRVAQAELFDRADFAARPAHERAQLLALWTTWCERHAGADVDSLERMALRRTTNMHRFHRLCESRARAKDVTAIPAMIERTSVVGASKAILARCLYQMDSRAAVPWALEHLGPYSDGEDYFEKDVRFHAALIVMAHGGRRRAEGLETLNWLDVHHPDRGYLARAAPVLARMDPSGQRLDRCGDVVWNRSAYALYRSPERLRRMIFELGCRSAFDWLDRQLASNAEVGKLGESGVVTEGDQAAAVVALWKGGPPYRMARPPAERRAERSRLRAWLRAEFQQLEVRE